MRKTPKDKEQLTDASAFLKIAATNERISVWHISLYLVLLCFWHANERNNPFYITRKAVMKLSHINGLATYHKYIRELQELGYISYIPSYNPFLGSLVYLCPLSHEPSRDLVYKELSGENYTV